MAVLPPPQSPILPNASAAMRRFMIVTGVFLVLILVLGVEHVKLNGPALSRIYPQAITKALLVSNAADAAGHGTATMYEVHQAANHASLVAVVDNLGAISGNVRAVEYNVHTNGTWVKVCAVLPVGGYPAYAVVCPGV